MTSINVNKSENLDYWEKEKNGMDLINFCIGVHFSCKVNDM